MPIRSPYNLALLWFASGLTVLFHLSMFPSSSNPSRWKNDVCDVVKTTVHPAQSFVLSLYIRVSVVEKADVYSLPQTSHSVQTKSLTRICENSAKNIIM
ncbi:hypothetical protein PISMIDRAFT_289260 [Pisolithus microcarpus 441]|uniref:Secreted protein n=1 Tax=Pisolithus microcarpus 441 TaxID=765257 RepID=A0A0C9Z092_9AGAM|nr:hypothetical protein BKA83DRAFT_289260 [Pisolithus microcarpus]KIK15762.1 hypothetical protein PISMIDRAFT_289260 [Pisolithus microcarpus 441]